MLATAFSATLVGLQAHLVRVEVAARRGPPYFELVGLAEAAVRESRVRVKSALAHMAVHISECQIVVNLAPADVKKTGSGFDLAIAAATLGALDVVPRESLDGVLFIGELSLEGTVQPLRGVLPQLLGARERGLQRAVVPRANAAEASDPWPSCAKRSAGRSSSRGPRGRSTRARRWFTTIWPTCAVRPVRAAPSRSRRPGPTTCS
jgi:magnesium chelatase family protein